MNDDILGRVEAPFSAWQQAIVFDAKRYKRWKDRGESVKTEVRVRQRALERAVCNGPDVLGRYLRKQLGIDADERIGAPPFPREALSVNEYRDPPRELEVDLGRAWATAVSPRWASRAFYWLLCHVDWIEQGRLGEGNLRPMLMEGGRDRELEGRVRNLLRRTGGIPVIRGKVSVFSDCTLARAWWRHRLSQEIARVTNGETPAQKAHRILHHNRPAWERLALLSIRRVTVINHAEARAAVVDQLGRRLEADGRIREKHVQRIAGTIARVGLRYSIPHVGNALMAEAMYS